MWIKNGLKKLRLASVESVFLEIWLLFFFRLKNRRDEEKNWIGSQTIGRYLDSIHRQNSFFSIKLSIFHLLLYFFFLGSKANKPVLGCSILHFVHEIFKFSTWVTQKAEMHSKKKAEKNAQYVLLLFFFFFWSRTNRQKWGKEWLNSVLDNQIVGSDLENEN